MIETINRIKQPIKTSQTQAKEFNEQIQDAVKILEKILQWASDQTYATQELADLQRGIRFYLGLNNADVPKPQRAEQPIIRLTENFVQSVGKNLDDMHGDLSRLNEEVQKASSWGCSNYVLKPELDFLNRRTTGIVNHLNSAMEAWKQEQEREEKALRNRESADVSRTEVTL